MIRTWVGTQIVTFTTRYRIWSSFNTQKKLLSSMSVQQPPWSIPEKQVEEPVLRIYNSLTKTKVYTMLLSSVKLF